MEKQENLINKELLEANRRLGVIISILIRMLPKEAKSISLKDQVMLLDGLGMRPKHMAEILGRTQSHINKELAGARKERKKHVK